MIFFNIAHGAPQTAGPPTLLQMQDFQHYAPLELNLPPGVNPPPGANLPLGSNAPVTVVPPSRGEENLAAPILKPIKGIIIRGSYQSFKPEGVGGIQGVDIEGPPFLKSYKATVSVWTSDSLGKPLTTNVLQRLKFNLQRACRQLGRPNVEVNYPQQEVIDGVVQIVIIDKSSPGPPPTAPRPKEKPPAVAKARESTISLITPPVEKEPLVNPDATNITGIVILGSWGDFRSEGTNQVRGLEIKGPDFLKNYKSMVAAWTRGFLGKPLTTNALNSLQVNLIRACRQIDHPMVDAYYPEQEVSDGVVQIIIYEGRVGRIDIDRLGRSTFSVDEIKDLPGLANKLKKRTDPVSAFLWTNDWHENGSNIFQWAVTNSHQAKAVVQALNVVIGGEDINIYDADRFKGIALRPETINLLKNNPRGPALATLNRLLLEDAYPRELSRIHLARKWFSDAYLTNQIHLKPGDSVSQEKLRHDLEKLNRNPQFLDVSAYYHQGKFNEETNSGTTDIGLEVKERFPLYVFAGYDNYGLKVLGENQIFGGFTYGNLFGVSDQLSYQYTTDLELSYLQAHTASFVDPLPWGHTLTIYGGYNDVNANLAKIGYANLKNGGYTYQTSIRYLVPLPLLGRLDHDISAGFDFKSANTAIEFGQVTFTPFAADVDQFTLTYRARLKDKGGQGFTQLTLNGYYSPGDLMGRDTDADYSSFHPKLKSDYYYGRAEAERVFVFDKLWGLWLLGKAGYQNSSTGLLPSEQFYLGGHSILRGYPEDIASGDQGYYATAEVHSPLLFRSNLTGQRNLPGRADGDGLDVFGFFDCGGVDAVQPNSTSYLFLDSFGAGLSYHISQNFKTDFSYGFQLQRLPAATPGALSKDHSRADVSATLSF